MVLKQVNPFIKTSIFLWIFQKTLFTEHLRMTAPADSFIPTKVLSMDHTLLVFPFISFLYYFFTQKKYRFGLAKALAIAQCGGKFQRLLIEFWPKHTVFICCTKNSDVDWVCILWFCENRTDVASNWNKEKLNSKSLTCLTKIGKNLSSSSQFPSFVIPY